MRALEALEECVCASDAGSGWALWRQQWGFEGAASGTLTWGEHLAGEMMKGVVSFWGGTDPSVRTCRNTEKTFIRSNGVHILSRLS